MIIASTYCTLLLLLAFVYSSNKHFNIMQVLQDEIIMIANEPENNACAVCLDELINKNLEHGELVKCSKSRKHIFHCECAFINYISNSLCPCCRADWTSEFEIFLTDFILHSLNDISKQNVLIKKLGEINLVNLLKKVDYSFNKLEYFSKRATLSGAAELSSILANLIQLIKLSDMNFIEYLFKDNYSMNFCSVVISKTTYGFVNRISTDQVREILVSFAVRSDCTDGAKSSFIQMFLDRFENQFTNDDFYILFKTFLENSIPENIKYLNSLQTVDLSVIQISEIIKLFFAKYESEDNIIEHILYLTCDNRKFHVDDIISIMEAFVIPERTVNNRLTPRYLHDTVEVFYKQIKLDHLTKNDIIKMIDYYIKNGHKNSDLLFSSINEIIATLPDEDFEQILSAVTLSKDLLAMSCISWFSVVEPDYYAALEKIMSKFIKFNNVEYTKKLIKTFCRSNWIDSMNLENIVITLEKVEGFNAVEYLFSNLLPDFYYGLKSREIKELVSKIINSNHFVNVIYLLEHILDITLYEKLSQEQIRYIIENTTTEKASHFIRQNYENKRELNFHYIYFVDILQIFLEKKKDKVEIVSLIKKYFGFSEFYTYNKESKMLKILEILSNEPEYNYYFIAFLKNYLSYDFEKDINIAIIRKLFSQMKPQSDKEKHEESDKTLLKDLNVTGFTISDFINNFELEDFEFYISSKSVIFNKIISRPCRRGLIDLLNSVA